MAFDGELSPAAARVLQMVAEGMAPASDQRISDWVDEGHVILSPATNSPRLGPVTFDGVEYIREILDFCHPDHPMERGAVRGGAQSGKSMIGQLWMCWSMAVHPMSFAVGLPTSGEVLKYNDYKLQPLIDASPALKHRVRPASTKGTEGSNARKKKLYTGASILLFNMGSPAELQMISTGNLLLEEIANALKEVGTRGSPLKQARERQAAYSVTGSKELMVSTAGEIGECEITRAEEEGDQRRFYGRCIHCLGFFRFEPEGFVLPTETSPAHFVCPGCGCEVEDKHRAFWRGDGYRWVPSFPSEDPANPSPPEYIATEAELRKWQARPREGRNYSWYLWQAFCGLISLRKVAGTVGDAKTPEDFKALDQQVYGRAHDPAVEALEFEELHRIREDYETRVVPEAAGVVTGFADIQGGYIEAGAIAWGPGGEWWVIDREVFTGDTSGDEPWRGLDEFRSRTYPHAGGGELPIEAMGVDSGYLSPKVYAFVRGRPNCYAMDGRPGWNKPILGKAKIVKIVQNGRVVGRTKLWPSGTWPLKSLLYWSLKISIEAGYSVGLQGRGHWSRAEDEAWCQQITAEVLHEEKDAKTGETKRWWKTLSGRRNEWVDIWVGARALAWMLGVGAAKRRGEPGEAIDWAARAAARTGQQQDLFSKRADTPAPAADASPARTGRFFRRRT